ncbi:MAG: glycosyltransferase family 39 protein [Anaerolineae bacterium]
MRSRARSLWGILSLVAVWLAINGQRHLAARDYVLDGVVFVALAVVFFLLVVMKEESEASVLWPRNNPLSQESHWVTLTHGRVQQLLIYATVLLAAVAFLSLAKNRFTLRGVLCWWGAVIAWLLATVEIRSRSFGLRLPSATTLKEALRSGVLVIRTNWVAVALLGIFVLALFFRIYRIDAIPIDPESDHVEASKDVWDILQGQYRIFFPRNTGREPTQFYLTAALSRIFGYGFVTLKLTMALVGVLNVIPMYFLGKELLDKRFGLLAAFFIAISYWHIIISRIGLRIVLAPLWTAATLYFLLRAFRTRQRNDFLLAGLCLGLGLYGYYAFRIMPLLIVVLCALKVLVDREPGFQLGRVMQHFILLVITSALVFLPMLRYMYDEPKMYWYRALTRTTNLEVSTPRDNLRVFADNVKRAFLMFNWMGDDAWPESVPLRPALDYVSGGLFILGAAYVLYLLFLKRKPIALYLVVSMFVLLLPSTLAIAFPIENPSNLRASAVIPVMILLVALPVYLVGRRAVQTLRGSIGILLVLVLGGLMLWQAARLNFQTYFTDYREHYRRSAWNATDMARVIRSFGDIYGGIQNAYLICTPYWIDGWAISLVLGDITWANFIFQPSDMEPHLAEPRNRLYIYNPINVEAERWLLEHYPNGQLMRFEAFSPDKNFMIYFAPAQW